MDDKPNVDPRLKNLGEVDRLVHEPARLMILMVLYSVESADFTFLVNATELTDGNVSSHASKLEEAGYIKIEKGYAGKRPRTTLSLTRAGRQAVDDYSRTMQEAMRNLSQ